MKVICVGDSVTYGQNVRANQAWPAVLARRTGWDVRNEGVCGDTTRIALERFPKAVQLHAPEVVVLQFGHNDANCWETDFGEPRVSLGAYLTNLREMENRALAAGARQVIVLRPHSVPGKSREYNDRLASYRLELTWGEPPPSITTLDDGYDGVHPDPDMHRRYAELVQRLISAVKPVPA